MMRADIPSIRQRHNSASDIRSSSNNVSANDDPRNEQGRSLSSSSLATRFVESNDAGLRLASSSLGGPVVRSVENVQNLQETVNCSEAVGQAALPINTNSNRAVYQANRLAAVYVPGYPLGPAGSPSTTSSSSSLPILDLSYPLNDSHVSSTSSHLSPVSETPPDHLLNNPLTSSTRYADSNPNATSSGASSSLYENIPPEDQPEPLANSTRRESLSCFYEEFADSVGESDQPVLQPDDNQERVETERVQEDVQEVQDEMEVEVVEAEEQTGKPGVREKIHATRSRGTVNVEPELAAQPRTTQKNRPNLRTRDGRVTRPFHTCGICGKGFRQQRTVLSHVVSHLKTMCKETIECSVCQRIFGSKIGLASHLRTHVNRAAPSARS